ncbi:MAG: hypothetical protein MI740_17395 [Halanaerobiales bacterium]|nr:hypothetical protein [Halanaerobiales bacterium]
MYYCWKEKAIRPSDFYRLERGEEAVIRAFFLKEIEERREIKRQMQKNGFACPYLLSM